MWRAADILLGRSTLPLGKMPSQQSVARSAAYFSIKNNIDFHIMLVDCKHKGKVPVHVLKAWGGGGEQEVQLSSFVASAIDTGKWSTLHPGPSTT
jgi:hypothetical protein